MGDPGQGVAVLLLPAIIEPQPQRKRIEIETEMANGTGV
jgi:hypothetical protein